MTKFAKFLAELNESYSTPKPEVIFDVNPSYLKNVNVSKKGTVKSTSQELEDIFGPPEMLDPFDSKDSHVRWVIKFTVPDKYNEVDDKWSTKDYVAVIRDEDLEGLLLELNQWTVDGENYEAYKLVLDTLNKS